MLKDRHVQNEYHRILDLLGERIPKVLVMSDKGHLWKPKDVNACLLYLRGELDREKFHLNAQRANRMLYEFIGMNAYRLLYACLLPDDLLKAIANKLTASYHLIDRLDEPLGYGYIKTIVRLVIQSGHSSAATWSKNVLYVLKNVKHDLEYAQHRVSGFQDTAIADKLRSYVEVQRQHLNGISAVLGQANPEYTDYSGRVMPLYHIGTEKSTNCDISTEIKRIADYVTNSPPGILIMSDKTQFWSPEEIGYKYKSSLKDKLSQKKLKVREGAGFRVFCELMLLQLYRLLYACFLPDDLLHKISDKLVWERADRRDPIYAYIKKIARIVVRCEEPIAVTRCKEVLSMVMRTEPEFKELLKTLRISIIKDTALAENLIDRAEFHLRHIHEIYEILSIHQTTAK